MASVIATPSVGKPLSDDVGIIIPPPNVRSGLEKTALAVGRKPALEARIIERHGSDPKFSFLRPTDPYHAYYLSRVAAVRDDQPVGIMEAKQLENNPSISKPVPSAQKEVYAGPLSRQLQDTKTETQSPYLQPQISNNHDDKSRAAAPSASFTQEAAPAVSKLSVARVKADTARPIPTKPPPDNVFSIPDVTPTPGQLTLDVMKLTAQFAARFGREFVQNLAAKEHRNQLFDFLRPLHPFHIVFQQLLNAYTAILKPEVPRKELVLKFQAEAASRQPLLDQAWYRHDWKLLDHSKVADDATSMLQMEAEAVTNVDWQDFVVVETIDFDEHDENLPAPLADPSQIPRVMAAAEAARQEWENNRRDVDMDMDMDMDDETDDGFNPQDAALGPVAGGVIVTADAEVDIPQNLIRKSDPASSLETWNHPFPSADPTPQTHVAIGGDVSNAGEPGPDLAPSLKHVSSRNSQSFVSPGDLPVRLPDGQIVPMSEATPAMRAQLLDPKYKEEQLRAAQKNIRQNLADGEQIALHLSRLNREKPDSGTYNRGDLQESLSGRAPTRPSAPKLPMAKPSLSGPNLPPVMKSSVTNSAKSDIEQPAKRARVEAAVDALSAAIGKSANAAPPMPPSGHEGDDLIDALHTNDTPAGFMPESEWISKTGDKVQIRVVIPVHANKDWNLNGQEINMEVPLRSTAVKLKEALADVVKLPANKQKLLCGKAGFMKDRMTLAYYNVASGATIHLELKERGGRGKR